MDTKQLIATEANELLSKIVDQFEVEVTEDHGAFHITIKTDEEAPVVIGRHGETIKAIQKILEVVAYKKVGSSVELLVNVNDYRQKQQERLLEIADRSAGKALDYHSPSYVRGLSSYERKVVHEHVTKNYPDLSSYSIGEGRDRRLVITTKDDSAAPEQKQQESSESEEAPVQKASSDDNINVDELVG